MKKIMIKVKGMHCKSCEVLIKDALEEIAGINGVSISSDAVTIVYNEKQTNPEAMRKCIEEQGYKAV